MKSRIQDAVKKATLSSGKVVYFRQAKVIDQEQAIRQATREGDDGNLNAVVYAKDYTERLIIAIKRKNGDDIKFYDSKGLLRKEGVFSFEEIIELTNVAQALMTNLEKKAILEDI